MSAPTTFAWVKGGLTPLRGGQGFKSEQVNKCISFYSFTGLSFQDGCLPFTHRAGKTKRVRTSFKQNQLLIMKTYFALNHNPDSKDLKQLSIKTGLSKRVLQVWFQNARAKYRRILTQRDVVEGHMHCELEQ